MAIEEMRSDKLDTQKFVAQHKNYTFVHYLKVRSFDARPPTAPMPNAGAHPAWAKDGSSVHVGRSHCHR